MTKNDEGTKDILGLAPYGEALNTLAKGAVEGAGAFLGRICLPAAEEFGLLLRDRIGGWRANNAVKIALKAQTLFEKYSLPANFHAHPRLVMKVVQEGSWAEADEVQDMWAGLLTSSCSEDGMDETNLIFVTILAQLTHAEASILKYGCEKCEKQVSKAGWIGVKHELIIDLGDLERITGVHDIHRLDRELDHLRVLGLIGNPLIGGFSPESTSPDITPTSLALQMYTRCQGYHGSPVEYYGLQK